MKFIGKIIFSIGLSLSSLFGFHQETPKAFTASASFTPVQASQFTLAGAGITSSQTTIQLTSFTLPDPNKTPISMSMFGDRGYAVLEPQTSKIENISFTGVTQNANGSATLTGVTRGISFYSPYLGSTTLSLAHSGGAYLILSNSAAFYGKEFLFANNIGTSTAILTYSSTTPPRYDSVAAQAAGTFIATTSEFASIAYVNAHNAAGCATASAGVTGCVRLGTAAQQASSTFSAGTPTVITTANATDTPQSGCNSSFTSIAGAGCGVIAQLTGKIRQTFLNLAEAWTFTNNLTIPASTANPLTLNTKAYQFPSTYGVASSSVLQSDTSGNVSWGNGYPRVLLLNTVTAGTVTAATTTLLSYTIPANTFGINKLLRITAETNIVGNTTGLCNYGIDYGNGLSTSTIAFGVTDLGVNQNTFGQMDATIVATTTTSQMATGRSLSYLSQNAVTIQAPSGTSVAILPGQSIITGRPANVNTTAQSYISFSGNHVSGAGTCTITGAMIELLSQ